jgi:hypothetical protein
VIVPRPIERDVFRQAIERVGRENLVRAAFADHRMTAAEAVEKYGAM